MMFFRRQPGLAPKVFEHLKDLRPQQPHSLSSFLSSTDIEIPAGWRASYGGQVVNADKLKWPRQARDFLNSFGEAGKVKAVFQACHLGQGRLFAFCVRDL